MHVNEILSCVAIWPLFFRFNILPYKSRQRLSYYIGGKIENIIWTKEGSSQLGWSLRFRWSLSGPVIVYPKLLAYVWRDYSVHPSPKILKFHVNRYKTTIYKLPSVSFYIWMSRLNYKWSTVCENCSYIKGLMTGKK